MDPLDGNAIGGLLFEVFGTEMTTAAGACSHCGAPTQAAELRVYLGGPGTVGRCQRCGAIMLVITRSRDVACVDLQGFASLELPA